MLRTSRLVALALVAAAVASTAEAQSVPDRRWSVDFAIGFDNGISGNINSGAIGTYNGQTTVILKNKYEDVYGTGLHIRFGGGYLLKEDAELRVHLTIQSLDADLVHMGDFGASNLYGQYDDYQSVGLDVGYRQYFPLNEYLRGYGEALIGLAFVDETDVTLSAPQSGLIEDVTDFYDRTAAFALAVNVGAMYAATDKVEVFAQIGLRYVTGMTEVDALVGTGLETINDKSARWSLPVALGVRLRF
jgi:hypothetical protein